MKRTRKNLLPFGIILLALSLTACQALLPGPEPEVEIAPPSWLRGTWENSDTGETITVTATDILFNGSSLRSWAERNELSVADFEGNGVDSRFSDGYWVNSGAPGSDLTTGARQFDANRFIDPPDYIRVVGRPAFSGFSSIDFQQTDTGSGGTDSSDDTDGGGSTTTGISVWTSNSEQGHIDVYINGSFRGTLTSYLSSGTPDYGQSGTITVELAAGSHSISAEVQGGDGTWGPSTFTLQSGDQLLYELR